MGLLYEVVVTHSKQVISVKGSYYSTINDKNSVKYSTFISDLNNKAIYKDLSYKVRTGLAEEDFIELSNCYVIADGGYLEWPATITGYPGVSSVPAEYKFTDWVASVRKDVECFFGILKKRFLFFKNPITLQNMEDIDNAFYTACIINNLILKHDGLDKLWLDDVSWENTREDGDIVVPQHDILDIYTTQLHDDVNFVPVYVHDLIPPYKLRGGDALKLEYNELRNYLANHLQIMYQIGLLRWPKSRIEIEKIHNLEPREHFPNAGDLVA